MTRPGSVIKKASPASSGIRVTDPAGGYLLWIELPERIDTLMLYRAALKDGIAITPGHLFSAGDRYRNFIRLNAANWSDAAAPAIRRLGQVIERMSATT